METPDNASPPKKTRGRPFAPGNRGGPGRPPVDEAQRAAKKVFALAVDRAVENITAALAPGIPQAINVISELATDPRVDPAVRLQACREFLDRSLGKPLVSQQNLNLNAAVAMSSEEIKRRGEAIAAHLRAGKALASDVDIFS
jgi:hypothetical protein